MHYLYIDPGTGSMLFTILIGVAGAGFYAVRNLVMKLRFRLSGGKQEKVSKNKIPIVIFTDSKRYWNLFEPICDEFEKRKTKLVYMTASEDDPAFKKQYQYIECQYTGAGNRTFAKLNLLNAGIVLSSTPGLDVYQWKRSKDVDWYVHIPHAASDITMYRMFGIDYYDAILTTGQYQIDQVRALEAVRKLPAKETCVVGLPYLDIMAKRLEAAPPLPPHERTVLLAPSWGKSAIFSRFGGRIIDALHKTGYHIIVRPHPQSFISEKEQMEKLMQEYPESSWLEWNRDNDNFEVLRRADLLISDFSGVIFDFTLVYDKPVIYTETAYDKAPYDCCWLKDETWTFTVLPKIGMPLREEDLNDMKVRIDQCLEDQHFAEARRQARDEAWQCRGHGAENVAEYLIKKQQQLYS